MDKQISIEKIKETKEIICPICKKVISPNDFNAYYGACENCVNKSGRIG